MPTPETPAVSTRAQLDRLRIELGRATREMSFEGEWVLGFERRMQALYASAGSNLEALRTHACAGFLLSVDIVNLHQRFQYGAQHLWRSVKGPGEELPQSPPVGWTRVLLQNKTVHYFPLEIVRETTSYDAARGLLKLVDWKEPLRQASELLENQQYGRDRTDHLAAIYATIEHAVLNEAITEAGSTAPRSRM